MARQCHRHPGKLVLQAEAILHQKIWQGSQEPHPWGRRWYKVHSMKFQWVIGLTLHPAEKSLSNMQKFVDRPVPQA